MQRQNHDVLVFLCSYLGAVATGTTILSAFLMAWPFFIQDHDGSFFRADVDYLIVPMAILIVSFALLIIPSIAIFIGLKYLRMVSLGEYLATALTLPILINFLLLMMRPYSIGNMDLWQALEAMLILVPCTLAGAYVFYRIEKRMTNRR